MAGSGNGAPLEGAVREAAGGRVRAEISPEPLQPGAARERVGDEAAGAVVLFVGTVRRRNRDRDVAELTYEAYAEMAAEELARIATEARERHGLERVDAVHRVGRLVPGEAAVAVAASSGHREAAFEGTRWLMEELKRRAPIWKHEVYADGSSEWLGDEEHGPCAGAEDEAVGHEEVPDREDTPTRKKGERAS